MTQRNILVDQLKGWACFLVVFGHVILGIRSAGMTVPFFSIYVERFIWSFHIGLFMFLSGFVYHKFGEWESRGSRSVFIAHKALNILIPYFVFASIYIAVNSSVSEVNHRSDIDRILWLWKEPEAQYWFLYALFLLFIFWVFLSGSMKNWHILIFLSVLNYAAVLLDIHFGSLSSAMSMAFSFGLGTVTEKLFFSENSSIKKMLVIVLHVLVVGFFSYMNVQSLPILKEAGEALGIAASICFITLITKFSLFAKVLLLICKYSFPIYLLHTIFTAGIRIGLNYAGWRNYWIQVLVGTGVGILAPVLIAMLCSKTPFLDFLFYPSKYLEKFYNRSSRRFCLLRRKRVSR